MATSRGARIRRACTGRRGQAGALRLLPLLVLLPLLGGCAVMGYPSPFPPRPTVATAAPSGSEPRASTPSATAGSYVVFGQRYYVLASAEGYRETGVASWYGGSFAGRPTANGEIYDPNGISAAHRSLPLSTWVEVTNLDNGRSLVLRVNDRGPFADPHLRIIDLSYGAALELGVVGPGLARVEVRALPAGTGVASQAGRTAGAGP